jgi:hypothetical protein
VFQALYAVICCLAISEAVAEAEKIVKSSIVTDNVSAESAPRLYRNVPTGVYASASPYAAFSFQIPAFLTAPKAAASRLVPVKEQLVLHNANGYLRDSYGNKFVGTPQTAAYKSAFPAQYLPLQELPAHLAQPLIAAAPQVKQASPHYFGSQYGSPSHHKAGPSYGISYGGFIQPFGHSDNFRNFGVAAPVHQHVHVTDQQQPNSNRPVFSNFNNGPKIQRLEYKPEQNYNNVANIAVHNQPNEEKGQIQAAAAKTSVTAVVNGKKSTINVDTKPPVPLLDISLLEPLKFNNDHIPQVQHFLTGVMNENISPKKQFIVIQKTQSYDDGSVKEKPRKETPQKKSKQHHAQYDSNEQSVQPKVTINERPLEASPEIVYEINEPNYKETIKEQSLSYNRQTQSDPEHYSYDEQTEGRPVNYMYQNIEQKEPMSYLE